MKATLNEAGTSDAGCRDVVSAIAIEAGFSWLRLKSNAVVMMRAR